MHHAVIGYTLPESLNQLLLSFVFVGGNILFVAVQISAQSRTQALWLVVGRQVTNLWPKSLKTLGTRLIPAQSRIQSPQALWPAVGRQERLWGTGILLPQDFCGKTMEVSTELIQSSQSKNLNFYEFSRLSPCAYPLTKKPEDSGYDIDTSYEQYFKFCFHFELGPSLRCKRNDRTYSDVQTRTFKCFQIEIYQVDSSFCL